MTKLKYTLAIDDSCNLTVTDTSGYYDAGTNPTGFLTESNTDSPQFNVYKLSSGYFLNILLYNKFNVAPIIANATEGFSAVTQPADATYSDNFTPTIYNLTNDGTYTLKRFFIISEDYYNSVVGTGVFNGHVVYYTDGTAISVITDGDPVTVTIAAFLAASMTNATVLETDTSFISTCKLNACYFKLMSILLDANINDCPSTGQDKIVQSKDLIYMTLESIKYLQESNSLTQIQKLIEAVDGCCSICSTKPVITSSSTTGKGGCGCG
jgi:hypothetical protein